MDWNLTLDTYIGYQLIKSCAEDFGHDVFRVQLLEPILVALT